MHKNAKLRSVQATVSLVVGLLTMATGFWFGLSLQIGTFPSSHLHVELPTAIASHRLPQWLGAKFDRFAVLHQAMDVLSQEFVGEIPPQERLNIAAIDGVLAELGDQNTLLVRPGEFPLNMASVHKDHIGTGAVLEWVPSRKQFLVLQTYAGSEAAEAGLLPGDILVSLNGELISRIGRRTASVILSESGGSTIEVGYRRHNDSKETPITLDWITVPEVEFEVLAAIPTIGYVKMHSINESAALELSDVLADVSGSRIEALILDLRGIAAGSLEAAATISGLFTGPSLVATSRYTDMREVPLETVQSSAVPKGMPIAVLMNRFSAGESELVAGALQGHGVGQVIGETSRGLGGMQTWFELADDLRLQLTNHQWFTPAGNAIRDIGITPDILVESPAEELEPEAETKFDGSLASDPVRLVAEKHLLDTLADLAG